MHYSCTTVYDQYRFSFTPSTMTTFLGVFIGDEVYLALFRDLDMPDESLHGF